MNKYKLNITGHKTYIADSLEQAKQMLQDDLKVTHSSLNLQERVAEKKFDIDLSKGIEMEDTFKEFLEGKKVEVKSERHIWEFSGNHYVEYEYDGKPSGIWTTEADYWVLMLVQDIDEVDVPVMTYIIPIEKMKELARKYYHLNKTKGGDDKRTKGVLVPIEEIALSCLNTNV